MSTPNKKPTMMEMKNVVSNLIRSTDDIYKYLQSLDITLTQYINFKKDRESFDGYIKEILKKTAKKPKEEKDELVLPNKRSNKTTGKMPEK